MKKQTLQEFIINKTDKDGLFSEEGYNVRLVWLTNTKKHKIVNLGYQPTPLDKIKYTPLNCPPKQTRQQLKKKSTLDYSAAGMMQNNLNDNTSSIENNLLTEEDPKRDPIINTILEITGP